MNFELKTHVIFEIKKLIKDLKHSDQLSILDSVINDIQTENKTSYILAASLLIEKEVGVFHSGRGEVYKLSVKQLEFIKDQLTVKGKKS